MRKFQVLVSLLVMSLLLGLTQVASGQASELNPPPGTPWIWSNYVDQSIPDDKVYIFCSPDQNGDPVLGQLSVLGGSATCQYVWGKYDPDPLSPTYQQFVPFGGPWAVGASSNATDLESGFYQVIITCNPGSPNQQTYCRRAHVFVNETIVDFDEISAGCNPFTITNAAIGAVSDFVVYDPPATPFEVNANTDITVCFWVNHSYVSDLGFYLISPSGARVDLLPPVSAWDNPGVTDLNPAVLPVPCSTTSLNTSCNSGNHYNNFCFTSALPAGDPNYTACICGMPTPITGTFASADSWAPIYGDAADDGGWAVQIYDCFAADVGSLQRVTITFEGEGQCGETQYVYDSGPINETINDASCDETTAATYIVPLKETSSHVIENDITAQWQSAPTPWNPAWGSQNFVDNPSPVIDPPPTSSTTFSLVINDMLYDTLGNVILPNANYTPCSPAATSTFITNPTDASVNISFFEICDNSNGVQLTAVNPNGNWSADCGSCITPGGYFFPSLAYLGPNEITHSFGGVCPSDTTFVINVVDAPEVVSVIDTICNSTNTQFQVYITLIGGNPGSYTITDCITGLPIAGSWTGNVWQSPWINSPSTYCFEVTDNFNCEPVLVEGFGNCGCESEAASMPTGLQELCAYEAAESIHLNNYSLDGNDSWMYVLHTGQFGFLGSVISSNLTGTFYFQSATMNYNQVYYISHVVGNTTADPNIPVDLNDPCLSVSPGTPVRWFENPVPDAGLNAAICGKTIQLEAAQPTVGQGAWSSLDQSGVIYNPGFTFASTTVTIPNFDTNSIGCDLNSIRSFRWTVTNGPCVESDQVTMTFKPKPSAFAGQNFSVCGLTTSMDAEYSLCGPAGISNGFWSGSGSFGNPLNPNSNVNVFQPGCYDFIWTEFNQECASSSYVNVCFIEKPAVDANYSDSVCGLNYSLNAISTMGTGVWTGPPNTSFSAATSPQTNVQISMPPGASEFPAVFTWSEQNTGPNNLICYGEDSVTITFSLTPNASAGLDDEVCGNTYFLNADVLGFEYAVGTWKSDFVGASFSNIFFAGSQVTVPNTGVMPGQPTAGTTFGDSSWVSIPFTWVMDNNKCIDEDEVQITFYQIPQAFAGPDTSVCGKSYNMKGKYSIGASKGEWTMISGPSPLEPQWSDKFSPTSTVTVPSHGEYVFQWKEDNLHNSTCSTNDQVTVFFIEIPDVNAGADRYICGNTFELEANPSTGNGVWLPNNAFVADPANPNSETQFGLSGNNVPVVYIWQEFNEYGGIQCVDYDSVTITYMIQPTAIALHDTVSGLDHVCGLVETNIENIVVAQTPGITGSNVNAYWVANNAEFYFGGVVNPFARNPDSVRVFSYGVHEFNWVIENWQGDSVCRDTSDITIVIDFIEQPVANPGLPADTACGHYYNLGSEFSTTTGAERFGRWVTTSPNQIEFVHLIANVDTVPIDQNDPIYEDSLQWVHVHLADNINLNPPPVYNFTWIEYNYGELGDFCNDQASTEITFAPQPTGKALILHDPHCIGYEAKLKAAEDISTIIDWDWSNLAGGTIVRVEGGGTLQEPGEGPVWVQWPNAVAGQSHLVRLVTENEWRCKSPAKADTVFEPDHVPVDWDIKPAYCGEMDGEISLDPILSEQINTYGWVPDTLTASVWADPTRDNQVGLQTGDYMFWARTRSGVLPNPPPPHIDDPSPAVVYCRDTFVVHVGDTGYIAAMYQLSSMFDTTGVSPHEITINNLSYMVDSNYVSPDFINAVDAMQQASPIESPDADYFWRFYHISPDSVFDWYAPIEIYPWELPEVFDRDDIIEEASPLMTFEKAGFYKWEMIALSEFGCRDTIVGGYIKVEGVPMLTPGVNIMTPNGDGINDFLEFEAQSLRSMEGRILNRWGEEIYSWTWNETDQVPDPGWWDGKYSTGNDAPPGVYYYIIKAVGQKDQDFSGKEYSGFFHLIREKE